MSAISLNQLLHSVADAGVELFRRRAVRRGDRSKSAITWCHELLSTLGEASGVALARHIVAAYGAMSDDDKLSFFEALRSEFHVDADAIMACASAYHRDRDNESLATLLAEVEPRRQELFRRINMAPDGTATLVSMRRDLLRHLGAHPDLKSVDDDLAHLLASWFNRGFLTLERIDWNTPAAILEKVIAYESVHAIAGWDDLRRRLAEDRRCFAFFHGAMPDDPLIFVEVALTNGLSDSIQPLIDHERPVLAPGKADAAIFYSINNCHVGLNGISLGNFLIKQVVLELRREFPEIKTFATLSPVPVFRKWLSETSGDPNGNGVPHTDRDLLALLDTPDWFDDAEAVGKLRPVVMRAAATYLLKAKKGCFPYDPVARFHLGNGARLERINWLGDVSGKGLEQSAGILVNYLYDLGAIERNHEDYVKNQTIAAGPAVSRLLRK